MFANRRNHRHHHPCCSVPRAAMDLVLELFDEYVFDKVWAHLVPLSAFAASSKSMETVGAVVNMSTAIPQVAGGLVSSKWADFVSILPHPPVSADIVSSDVFTSTNALVSAWPRDYVPRQLISLAVLTLIGIHVLYFFFAGLSYQFIFNHDMMRHRRFLKNQVKLEIQSSMRAFPSITMLTLPWFQAEVMGYTKLYDNVDEHGWLYFMLSIPL